MTEPADPSHRRRINVEIDPGSAGQPSHFALTFGSERTVLVPSRSWLQLDPFKWATRGLIEPPQSFTVHPDGSIEYNGDSFHPEAPGSAAALAEKINQKHPPSTATLSTKSPTTSATPHRTATHRPHRTFRVHLDHLSHILVEAFRGSDRTETGLRGLAHLAVDGWIRQPRSIHVDPLQRYLELDGVRFENNAEGARELEEFLNQNFVPEKPQSGGHAITIRENAAASTGFDILFGIVRAGTRFEIKGHLSQERLDLLQDRDKCDLLQPGIILRLSPPYLYVRQRNHDGSESHVPGIPDIKYRSITATELEHLLNHPLLRNAATLTPEQRLSPPENPPPPGVESKAVPDSTPAPPPPTPPTQTPFLPPPKSPPPRLQSTPPQPPSPISISPTAPPPAPPPFNAVDPHHIHEAIFQELSRRLPFPVQDVLLSLPRVFTDRRFEILDFNGEEIGSVLQLRTDHFYGFYLTHLGPETVDLVYACHGTHLEWGTTRCTIQPSPRAETSEYKGPALLGLAQDVDHHFVFIVESSYREWIRHYEPACEEAYARFLTPEQWAARSAEFPLLWPANPST